MNIQSNKFLAFLRYLILVRTASAEGLTYKTTQNVEIGKNCTSGNGQKLQRIYTRRQRYQNPSPEQWPGLKASASCLPAHSKTDYSYCNNYPTEQKLAGLLQQCITSFRKLVHRQNQQLVHSNQICHNTQFGEKSVLRYTSTASHKQVTLRMDPISNGYC